MAEVGQHMLLYKYMSNGSLFSHLHGNNNSRESQFVFFFHNATIDIIF